jgi:hypothetical protein
MIPPQELKGIAKLSQIVPGIPTGTTEKGGHERGRRFQNGESQLQISCMVVAIKLHLIYD